MRLWNSKPKKAPQEEITNAVVAVVRERLEGVGTHSAVFVKVSDFPEFAQNLSDSDKSIIRAKLLRYKIACDSLIGETYVFDRRP